MKCWFAGSSTLTTVHSRLPAFSSAAKAVATVS